MRFFLEESEHWFLWVPVLLGGGIALYFSLPVEPPLWYGGISFLIGVGMVFYFRHREKALLVALVFTFVSLGFLSVTARSLYVAAPVWQEKNRPVALSGEITSVENRAKGGRIILERISVAEESEKSPVPEKIRLNVKNNVASLYPGQRVALKAVLMAPPPPAAPYAYDFSRQAWFMGLGAVGYSLGNIEVVAGENSEDSWGHRLYLWYAGFRHSLTKRIQDGSSPTAGPISAALMTGGVGSIAPHILEAYRDSGLAHLLSISGLHMSLVAGFAFVMVRRGLALIPSVALRYPIKKWAAALSLPMTLFYLLVAGAPIPTIRAFVMIALVLLAVLTDRTAISLRLIAWAAIIVLFFQPESLLGASFQMSFAAVVALVAFYQENTGFLVERRRHWSGRIFHYTLGIVLTTLIAGGITSVYGLYHFNRLALYGVVANVVAIPITGFWVMPWAMIAFLLMPFGWEEGALTCMGWGVDALNFVATNIAAWPGAVIASPPLSVEALIVFTLGGVWLCFWRKAWRWWGVPVMAVSLLSLAWSTPPSFLIAGSGTVMAARAEQGELLIFPSARPLSMQKESWVTRNGGQKPRSWPKAGQETSEDRLRCDSQGCLYREGENTLSVVRDPAVLQEECETAAIVISLDSVSRKKRQQCAAFLIDRFDLMDGGTHAVWVKEKDILSTREWQGNRPWSTDKRKKTP